MRTAHLIITFTNPSQTERMIRRMYHPDFDFYIHVDKKVDINSHLHLSSELQNVFFIKNRVDVRWAGYNTSKAIFSGVHEICNSGKEYNFINLLSGQDYPLKPAIQLFDFFRDNIGKEFIAHKDMIHDWKSTQYRYKRIHLINLRFRGRYIIGQFSFFERIINIFCNDRKIPYGYHPYGESMFWMLSPEVALYVVDKVLNDKKLDRFFSYTWASDEFLFQTIIMNSHFKDKVINNNYRYIDWSEGKANPKILSVDDFEKLKYTTMLFGRKFDMSKDYKILDMIDRII